jgi:hypothetical protein
MTQTYFDAKNSYYRWRRVADDYRQKAAAAGLPDVLKRHYESQRLAALKHAATYRGLMLEQEKVTNV